MAHTPQTAAHWLGIFSGFSPHPSQIMSNGSKFLRPLRALFEGDLGGLIVALDTCACCKPAIWWTFLQAPEISASGTLTCSWFTWECYENASSDSLSLRWGWRFCISDKFPGDAYAAALRTTLWVAGSARCATRAKGLKGEAGKQLRRVPSPPASATEAALSTLGAAVCPVTSLLLQV